jgi:hypothetical protein
MPLLPQAVAEVGIEMQQTMQQHQPVFSAQLSICVPFQACGGKDDLFGLAGAGHGAPMGGVGTSSDAPAVESVPRWGQSSFPLIRTDQ